MRKAFLAILAVGFAASVAAAEVSGTAVQNSVPDYSSWTLADRARLSVPVSGLKVPMLLRIASGVYVEDVNDRDSRYVQVFWVLGNEVVRRLQGADNFQLLVKGVWRDCAVGAEPKVFLITGLKNRFLPFGETEVKGVRLELPADDGKSVLSVVVAPVVDKK